MNEKTLNDYCEFIIDCLHKTAPIEDTETGFYSIRTPDIGRGRLIIKGANRVSEDTYMKWTVRAVPQAGDLILAREAPVGNVGIVPENVKVCCGQRTVHIRPDSARIVPEYLVYLMNGDEIQAKIKGYSQGVTVAHLNMEDIRALVMPQIPSLNIQRRIADILSAYDDLIENNTRRIRILEQMAQAIYQEWFGKVDKENLPEGWKETTLSDVCERLTSGGTPSRQNESYWKNGEINWFKTKELADSFLFCSEEKISKDGYQHSSAKLFPIGTVVMAIYAAPTVGRLGILTQPSTFNQAACGLVPKIGVTTTAFLFYKLIELRT